jgi:hypothetical protein
MSWQATNWVIEKSRHKGSALLTMLCIANCANEDGSDAFPSKERLARDTRLSERQIARILEQLEKSGELAVKRSTGRHPNHYAFPFMGEDKMSPLPGKRPTMTNPTSNHDISAGNHDILTTNHDAAMSQDPSIERSIDPPEDPPDKSAAKAKRASIDGTRIPEPFLLTSAMRQWAKDPENAPDVNLKKATAEFVDYWRGRPGRGGKKLDWEATWRNRMRELQEKAERNRPRQPKGDSSVDAAKQAAAEFRNGTA